MAIIYTYPVKASPVDSDLVLISDSADSNNTKQVKVSSIRGATVSGVADVNISAVTSTLSSGAPLVSLPNSGNVIITSRAYAGTTNVGHVPTGGSATTFLRGDGSWIVPTNTTYDIMGSGNSYVAGLVLAGNATHNNNFLRKDGTWATPTSSGGISFSGTTASGMLSRGGATVADVSSDIIVAGPQILLDGSAGNTGVKYDLGTTTLQIGGIGGGTDTVDIYSAGASSLTISSTVSQFKNSSHTLFDNGIRFGSTGETLDAYEEGTWTPVMFNSVSPSYTSVGTYIKIGKKVTVWFYINCTAGGSASVASYISGLPFNAVSVNGRRGTAVINQNTGNSASTNYVGGKPGGATTIILQKYTSGTSYVLANAEWPNSQGNFTVEGQYTYYSLA